MLGPKERFSSRVDDYVKYRPSYPSGVIDVLQTKCELERDWVVADIGAGPGNLARLFLDNGNVVLGVEPNLEMREAGERLLGSRANYHSLAASAEETGLPDKSIDLIVAGQAFHWFDQVATRIEFKRILRPGGWIALIWNERVRESSEFLRRYDEILTSLPEYQAVSKGRTPSEELQAFFAPAEMLRANMYNEQSFNLKGFLGRVLSSSYVPQVGAPGHDDLMRKLRDLFQDEAKDGEVVFPYTTQVFFGQLR